MSSKPRRPKWHPTPPPPPSPKILHFPRRPRRKHPHHHHYTPKGKLETLFGQEREFSAANHSVPLVLLNSSSSPSPLSTSTGDHLTRQRVAEEADIDLDHLHDAVGQIITNDCGSPADNAAIGEERWKFQADLLRAECNFLRMERVFALKKLERNRKQMERALRSAVQTLLSGRNKMFEGKNESGLLLKEELEDLTAKLKHLQRSSRAKEVKLRDCNNFDEQACRLQHLLEKLGCSSDDRYPKDLQEIAESSLLTKSSHGTDKKSNVLALMNSSESSDVELLRRKMEGCLAKGMLDGMEKEYGSMLSTTADSSVASSTSTSKRIECAEVSSYLMRQLYQEQMLSEESKCSGRCKTLVRRIMDQVRAETEQWSQMQKMLGQVRAEMEELQASRDLWEDRALKSEHEITILHSAVREWKEKSLNSEARANELQFELHKVEEQLGKLRTDCGQEEDSQVMSAQDLPLISLGKHLERECCAGDLKLTLNTDDDLWQEKASRETTNTAGTPTKDLAPLSLGKQLEKEKRLLVLRWKENRHSAEKCRKEELLSAGGRRKSPACNNDSVAPKRPPFRDIGNSSPLAKQNTKSVFPSRGSRLQDHTEKV